MYFYAYEEYLTVNFKLDIFSTFSIYHHDLKHICKIGKVFTSTNNDRAQSNNEKATIMSLFPQFKEP